METNSAVFFFEFSFLSLFGNNVKRGKKKKIEIEKIKKGKKMTCVTGKVNRE